MISLPLTHKKYVLPHKIERPLRLQKDLAQDWQVWSYYEHLFKHPEMVTCEEYEQINGGMYLQLFFINKRSALLVLEKYCADFVEVLGEDFTPKAFLEKVEKKGRLRALLHHNDKLLGILLDLGGSLLWLLMP